MTATEQKLNELLKQNTGTHMLDSGGAYGRHWEKNQNKDFEVEPTTFLSFSKYGIEATHNLYHWLEERLTYDEAMDNQFQEWANLPENEDKHWLELMEEFPEINNEYDIDTVNTYNGEDMLSQTIQYTRFVSGEEPYVLLQVHGGADVRGGYSTPTVFIENDFYALADNARATIQCIRSDVDPKQMELPDFEIDRSPHYWDTEDAGYSWDYAGGYKNGGRLEAFEISTDEEDKGKGKIYADEDGNGYCPFCGSLLVVV